MTLRKAARLTTSILAVCALATPIVAEDLVRVDFQNEDQYRTNGGVFSDDGLDAFEKLWCEDSSEFFDIVDYRDATACGQDAATDGVISITWGNGRWKLQTGGVVPTYVRAVGLNFAQPVDAAADCARLANLPLPIGGEIGASDPFGGVTCSCAGPCTALATFRVDGTFKRGVTRQDVSFPVRLKNAAPAVIVDYVNPLYVCADPTDSDVRFLQTDGCYEGEPSVEEAEVFERTQTTSGDLILLGRWNMPLRIRLRRVSATTSDDGGGGGSCSLLQKGESCSLDNECCSANCRGKVGRKTCK